MENLLFYLLPEVVGHAAHESTLREVGDLGGGYEGVHLRVDGCGGVLPVDGEGLPLLEYLAEPLRQALCRLADHLPAEDVAHRVLDDLRLLVPVIPRQLAEVLESETDGHLVAPGGGDQVVNATEVDGGQLVDDDGAFELPFLVYQFHDTAVVKSRPDYCPRRGSSGVRDCSGQG